MVTTMMLWLKTYQHKLNKILFFRRIYGTSMKPSYKNGQIVIATSLLKVKKGRVVIAKHERNEVIKRVSQIKNGTLYLTGDNKNIHHNMSVDTSQISGVVI